MISLEEILFNDLKKPNLISISNNELRWDEFRDISFDVLNADKSFKPEKTYIKRYVKKTGINFNFLFFILVRQNKNNQLYYYDRSCEKEGDDDNNNNNNNNKIDASNLEIKEKFNLVIVPCSELKFIRKDTKTSKTKDRKNDDSESDSECNKINDSSNMNTDVENNLYPKRKRSSQTKTFLNIKKENYGIATEELRKNSLDDADLLVQNNKRPLRPSRAKYLSNIEGQYGDKQNQSLENKEIIISKIIDLSSEEDENILKKENKTDSIVIKDKSENSLSYNLDYKIEISKPSIISINNNNQSNYGIFNASGKKLNSIEEVNSELNNNKNNSNNYMNNLQMINEKAIANSYNTMNESVESPVKTFHNARTTLNFYNSTQDKTLFGKIRNVSKYSNLVEEFRKILKSKINFMETIESTNCLKITQDSLKKIIMPQFRNINIDQVALDDSKTVTMIHRAEEEPIRVNNIRILIFISVLVAIFVGFNIYVFVS